MKYVWYQHLACPFIWSAALVTLSSWAITWNLKKMLHITYPISGIIRTRVLREFQGWFLCEFSRCNFRNWMRIKAKSSFTHRRRRSTPDLTILFWFIASICCWCISRICFISLTSACSLSTRGSEGGGSDTILSQVPKSKVRIPSSLVLLRGFFGDRLIYCQSGRAEKINLIGKWRTKIYLISELIKYKDISVSLLNLNILELKRAKTSTYYNITNSMY